VRILDLLGIALSALYQQKVRTVLTTLGVIIGTFILIVSLSNGLGVQDLVHREFGGQDQLRQIRVTSGFGAKEANIPPEDLIVKGEMSDPKRERIRRAMIRWWSRKNVRHPVVPLTRERLDALAQLPHVQSVVPFLFQGGQAVFDNQVRDVMTCAATSENRHLRARLVAGDYFQSDNERTVVVHEYLLYLWGIRSEEDVDNVVGRKLRLKFHLGRRPPVMLLSLLNGRTENLSSEETKVLEKLVNQLPTALDKMDLTSGERDILTRLLKSPPPKTRSMAEVSLTEEYTIAGVIREFTDRDPNPGWGLGRIVQTADIFLPVETAEELLGRTPQVVENGFDSVTVTVDREENLKEVVGQIKAMGLTEFSLLEIFERVRINVILMTFATGFVATIALVVAALGITNTMVMGVLERTREIGVMKAVGARDSHIQSIFLIEGALIGGIGGGLGLLCGWLASFPGDSLAKILLEKQTDTPLKESLFVFPWWLTVGVPLLATAIAMLAALYPARRAVKVNPITALRHE
jgi:putative ABC transport system permease protein